MDILHVIVKWRIITYKFCLGTVYPNSNHIKVVGGPWIGTGVLCTTIGKDVGLRFGTKLARHMLTLLKLPTLCKKNRIDNYKPLLVIMFGTLPTLITMLLITCWSFVIIYLGKTFVKILLSILSMWQYLSLISKLPTFSFKYWYLMSICIMWPWSLNVFDITMHEGVVVKGALKGVWSINDWSFQVVYSKKFNYGHLVWSWSRCLIKVFKI